MNEIRLGNIEGIFANILWENAPLTTKEMVKLAENALGWKRTTTYTVLKKLCDRGIFALNDRMVTVLISKPEFHAIQSEQFVKDNFQSSLPAFLAAFTSRQKVSAKDLEEIKKLVDSLEETV